MDYRIIQNEAEYEAILAKIEEIMDAEPNTPDGDLLQLLTLLVQDYEVRNFPIEKPDPIEVVKFYIEQRGLKYKDLVGIIGDKTVVSKVINKERQLNLQMVKNLHDKMDIPYSLLLQD